MADGPPFATGSRSALLGATETCARWGTTSPPRQTSNPLKNTPTASSGEEGKRGKTVRTSKLIFFGEKT